MAQTRDVEFEQLLDSFRLNRKFMGILGDGRYRGLNKIQNIVGLTFDLAHDVALDAYVGVDIAEAAENAQGVWVSKQGVTIREDAVISLLIVSNAANAFQRIDMIIGNHEYNEAVTGGAAATYLIVQGANGGPVKPALPDDKRQTILGYLYIPASAAVATDVIYIPEPTPGMGGKPAPYLNTPNAYQKLEQWNEDAEQASTVHAVTGHTHLASFNGNFFSVNDSDQNNVETLPIPQAGTFIFLEATDVITLVDVSNSAPAASVYDLGYAPFSLLGGLDYVMEIGEILMLRYDGVDQAWIPLYTSLQFESFEDILLDLVNLASDIAVLDGRVDDLTLSGHSIAIVSYRSTNATALVGTATTELEIPFANIQIGSMSSLYVPGTRIFTAPANGWYRINMKAELQGFGGTAGGIGPSIKAGIGVKVGSTRYMLDKVIGIDVLGTFAEYWSGTLDIPLGPGAQVTFHFFSDIILNGADVQTLQASFHDGCIMQVIYMGNA